MRFNEPKSSKNIVLLRAIARVSDTVPKIAQLQQVNTKLIKEIEALKTRSKENKTNSNLEKLQQENIQLTAENQQLRREN